MLIDEQFRKWFALLGVRSADPETGEVRTHFAGTGFFVSVPVRDDGIGMMYLVTALHVVVAARPYGNMFVRINLKPELVQAGKPGFADIPIDPRAWHEHLSTDVAIGPWAAYHRCSTWCTFRNRCLSVTKSTRCVTGSGSAMKSSSPVCSVRYREKQFQPIVRYGNVSRCPVIQSSSVS